MIQCLLFLDEKFTSAMGFSGTSSTSNSGGRSIHVQDSNDRRLGTSRPAVLEICVEYSQHKDVQVVTVPFQINLYAQTAICDLTVLHLYVIRSVANV